MGNRKLLARVRAGNMRRASAAQPIALMASKVLEPIRDNAPMGPDFSRKVDVEANVAWQRLVDGHGTEKDYNDLAWVANVCEVGFKGQDVTGAMEIIQEASGALDGMRVHYLKSGKWHVPPHAHNSVPVLLQLHYELIKLLSLNQLEALLKKVEGVIQELPDARDAVPT